ncbi:hypothetical protein M9H77_20697 [Catharanthus roseus]|uniref:Uncharacterized protein n=1 Tax=Catharanthus roseus TaxID=4058 RepID=A0ACC0AKN7_CATRO|nr:hypothetical protein M9H77_20697 [Catharanthus roseus]
MDPFEKFLQENIGFEFCPDGAKISQSGQIFLGTFVHIGRKCQGIFALSGQKCGDEDPNTFEEFLEPEEYIDLGHLFTTDRIFSSKDELVDWAKQTAMNAKTYLIITRYQRSRTLDRRPYVTLDCERGGSVKKYKKPIVDDKEEEIPKNKRGPYGTKKCGCPFKLKREQMVTSENCQLFVYNGRHNHKIAVYGHAQTARLMEEQLQQIEQFRKSHVPHRNILRFFREQDVGCAVSAKKIYNVVAKITRNRMQGRNTVEEVLRLSAERGYTVFHKNREDSNILSDIVVAHPTSITMIRTWPYVLIMDTTYKTNKVWTSQVLHFRVETTNRAESEHSVLKLWLSTYHGDLDTVFLNIGSLIQGQIVERVTELIKKTNWEEGSAPPEYWMDTPYHLYVIANTFNLCVIFLARSESTTVLPLVSNMDGTVGTIFIRLIEELQHFIQLQLVDGCPLPPIIGAMGLSLRVSGWAAPYRNRMADWVTRYREMYPPQRHFM